jgi:lysozyme
MEREALVILTIAGIAGAVLLGRFTRSQADGSGGGAITTENTTEGSIMDPQALGAQLMADMTPAPAENPTNMSGAGLLALTQREGFAATPYPDHKGQSIGFGHLIKAGESFTSITRDQGMALLASDVQWATEAVAKAIKVPLSQGQFDALVSFAYNVGAPAFTRSTLVQRINAGDPGASSEFGRWVYASGVVDSGLVARRHSEQSQFESATA